MSQRLAAERDFLVSFARIQIGTYKTFRELRHALADGGYRVSDYAIGLMNRMTLVLEPKTLDLYWATNAELGLTHGGTVEQSFEAIAKIGGEKLPAEAGPQYCLQSPDQPMGRMELMCMDPIPAPRDYPSVFGVERDEGGRRLCGCYAYPRYFNCAEDVWVFGRK